MADENKEVKEVEEKPDYDEISKFIIENASVEKGSDPTEVTLQVTKEPYRNYMKTRGVSRDTLKKVSDAHNDYMNASIKAAGNLMLKDDPEVEKLTIRTRTDIGRLDTIVRKSIPTNNPKTGEKIKVRPKKLPFFKVGKDLREQVNKND